VTGQTKDIGDTFAETGHIVDDTDEPRRPETSMTVGSSTVGIVELVIKARKARPTRGPKTLRS
jgi:hypothetical protein